MTTTTEGETMSTPTRIESTELEATVRFRRDGTATIEIPERPEIGVKPKAIGVRPKSAEDIRVLVGERLTGIADELGRSVRVFSTEPDGSTWTLTADPGRDKLTLLGPGELRESPVVEPGEPESPAPELVEPAVRAGIRPRVPRVAVDERPAAPSVVPAGPVASIDVVPPPPVQRPKVPTGAVMTAPKTETPVRARLRPVAADRGEDWQPPSMNDLRAKRTQPRSAPAARGWQGVARHLTLGLWSPAPGERELQLRSYSRAVRRSLDGSRTVVFANPKGGAPKTTSATAFAAAVAEERGGDLLLWDNNPFMGNLAARAGATNPEQTNTVVQLLRDIDTIDSRARLNNYLRTVEGRHFLVLASSEDAAKQEAITGEEFEAVHRLLSKWFSLIVIDNGNDANAPNFQAAVEAADQVVVPISLGQAAIEGGMQIMAKLQSWGRIEKATDAVTVMVRANTGPNASSMKLPKKEAEELYRRAHAQFAPPTGWMRAFKEVPADPALAFDRPIEYERMSRSSQDAWLEVAAAAFDGL